MPALPRTLAWCSLGLALALSARAEDVVVPPEIAFGSVTPAVPRFERRATMVDRLSFEISFTNESGGELEFQKARLDYLDANELPMGSQEITDFQGATGLRRKLEPSCDSCTGNEIPAGAKVFLRFFIEFERKLTPASVDLAVDLMGIDPILVSGIEPIVYERNARPYRFSHLNPPAQNWAAFQAHSAGSSHRLSRTQRYAYDLVVVRQGEVRFIGLAFIDGNFLDCGPPTDTGNFNQCYFAWEKPIFAAADGIVVRAMDGMADNPPGVKTGGGGNVVVIDHGAGELSFHGHIRQGTVAFPPSCNAVEFVDGQWLDPMGVPLGPQCTVQQGDLLGQVGNTGSSGIPHLHVHLIDSFSADLQTLDPVYGDALPFHFTNMSYDFGSQPLFRHLRADIPTWNKSNNEPLLELDPAPLPPPPGGMGAGPGQALELEPNDELTDAQKLELPVTVTGVVGADEVGVLADGGDGIEDIFGFEVDQVRTICARLSFDAGSDLDMVLYSEKLGSIQPAAAVTLANPERLVATVLPGSYYLMVTDFDATQIAGGESYSLFVKFFGAELRNKFGQLPPGPSDPRINELLDTMDRLVALGQFRETMAVLEELRELAACGPVAGNCEIQREIWALIDEHIADLDPDPPRVFGRWVPVERPSSPRGQARSGHSWFRLDFGSVLTPPHSVIGVVRTPPVEGLKVQLHRSRQVAVKFLLEDERVVIGAPEPEQIEQELRELGGLQVPVGQIVNARIRPSKGQKVHSYRYDSYGRLLVQVPRATLTVIDPAIAPHRGTIHVNPALAREPIGEEGDYLLVDPREREGEDPEGS